MDLQPYIDGIPKTGFPFEFKIVRQLLDQKWTVISNKYYVDNDEERPRKIDIIAYKVNDLSDFNVYTALIISCKKSENND